MVHPKSGTTYGSGLNIYLKILQEASASWKPDEPHTFTAVPEPPNELTILRLLRVRLDEY